MRQARQPPGIAMSAPSGIVLAMDIDHPATHRWSLEGGSRSSAAKIRRGIPDMILVSVVVLLAAACASTAPPVTQLPRPTATAAPLARSTVHEVVVPVSLPTATLVAFPTPTAMVTEPAVSAVVPTSTIEPQVPVSEAPLRYTVRAGDTLLGIAMAFDVPMAALQLENELGGATLIHLDQVLEIPAAEMWTDASPFWVVHEVEEGQTLGEIAALNGIGVADLLAANHDIEADRISVGQTLVLPLKGPQEMVVKVTEPEPSAAPPDAVSAAAAVVVEDVVPAEETSVELEPMEAPAPAPPPVGVTGLADEIFRLVNAERAAYGLAPLAWSETLARAAQRHANDCYARGWCSHTGSDGSTYKQRIIREGYTPVRWSECWAWYGTAKRAVAMWMDEVPPNDPHRRTILNEALTEVGVGVVPANGYGYYFIADFGTPD